MTATFSNPNHPEYGQLTLSLLVSRKDYASALSLLDEFDMGDVIQRDCRLDEIDSAFPVLKRLEGSMVNFDELEYLAKRLDSFDIGEAAQFQAMTEKLKLTDMKDLINLTFCCQQTTVITDFSNLEQIGRDHYLNLHGGCASVQELEELDGKELALQLIDSSSGTVTRYGMVYDNGMELKPLYDGKHFPCYYYEPNLLTVALTSRKEPEDTPNVTWIFLPAAREQIDRAILRSGITDPDEMHFRIDDNMFPEEINAALDFRYESLYELNDLALTVDKLSMEERKTLTAAVAMAEPEYASQIRQLAENLDLFEFVPDAKTPEDYGKYMIQQSGRFEYDPELEEFYNYKEYGLRRMEQETGAFNDRGYLVYHGTMSLDELMMDDPAEAYQREQDFQMGDMGGMR